MMAILHKQISASVKVSLVDHTILQGGDFGASRSSQYVRVYHPATSFAILAVYPAIWHTLRLLDVLLASQCLLSAWP